MQEQLRTTLNMVTSIPEWGPLLRLGVLLLYN